MSQTSPTPRRLILNSAEVRALLERGEAVIERKVRPQPDGVARHGEPYCFKSIQVVNPAKRSIETLTHDPESGHPFVRLLKCPLGVPGSLLWIAEAWGLLESRRVGEFGGDIWETEDYQGKIPAAPINERDLVVFPAYRADGGEYSPWRSSASMPRWASRLSVRVVSVTVEQRDGAWCWCVRVEVAR